MQSKYEEEFNRSGVYKRLWEESQKKRELSRAQEMYVNGERNREWVRSREGDDWEGSVVIDHITGQRHVNVLAIVKQLQRGVRSPMKNSRDSGFGASKRAATPSGGLLNGTVGSQAFSMLL